MDSRSRAFQQLKPHCIGLSQAVLAVAARNGNPRHVVDALGKLHAALQDAASDPLALDDKLAEYVFFPLSHVLKEKQKFPIAALELTLQCLALLLHTGWRARVDPALSRQFLILLPALISGSAQTQVSEELKAAGFACVTELFITYGQGESSRKALTAADTIPPLGHAIVVILEGVTDGPSSNVQLAAAHALRAACAALDDREALASFLPGIVSGLAKVLTPSTKQRRPFELLRLSLEIMISLFKAVLSDEYTKHLPSSDQASGGTQQKLTQSWLKATATKTKQALANIIRIRQHDRIEVRSTLLALCLTVLEDCRDSLQDSAAMMIETMIVLCGSDEDGGMKFTLKQVLAANQRFAELLRSSIHSWVISLPRVMQSPDDSAKSRLVQQIATGYELLAEQGVDMDLVDRTVASNLRDGITVAISDQSKLKEIAPSAGANASLDLALTTKGSPSVDFSPIFFDSSAQRQIIHDFRGLVKNVSTSKSALNAARDLVDSLHSSRGASQLASFWVALEFLKSSNEIAGPIMDFLDFGDAAISPREELMEELYSLSLDVLQDSSADSAADWRLLALATEAIALQASTLKEDFRIELVDALYPIVHLVGSSIPQLRSHAITCLNIVATSCAYQDVGSLIVENVDYLVNAVALKLNTFDISPQAPQVLLMMIKLSGPSLLPYLDDLVGSVFAALESFHGYPKLVELLFSVLKGIAEEGVKTPQLAITEGEDISKTIEPEPQTTIDDIVTVLKDIQAREAKQDDDPEHDITEITPQHPWKDLDKKKKNPLISEIDEDEEEPDDDNDDDEEEEDPDAAAATTTANDPPSPPPPAPKTYDLLLRISRLTQHHLASPSPALRSSLLALLRRTSPALARHEDSFLPLVDALWPVVVQRLADQEAYVVAAALEVAAQMCGLAGDFMRGRVEGVWGVLVGLWRRGSSGSGSGGGGSGGGTASTISLSSSLSLSSSSRRLDHPGGGAGADAASSSSFLTTTTAKQIQPHQHHYYTTAPTRIVRAALLELFTTIVRTVRVGDDLFEELLELLVAVVAREGEVRRAFEERNADAVWLAVLRWEVGGGGQRGGGGDGRRLTTVERVGRERPGAGGFVRVGREVDVGA
ncbi:heat repeat protein [Diplodia corticola]|uniref:Heat repeat protein n=1 Tax=Diplodia corticola TaxID=236234 RepID=A0A1J9S869_9PEZI|nr:heat repeat protein [Diplodia corticola]OJD36108.1 heat repeat protein [Diplodia corticola]